MNNVTKLNTRGTVVLGPRNFTKYEIFVYEDAEQEFESLLADQESWAWVSKTKTEVL